MTARLVATLGWALALAAATAGCAGDQILRRNRQLFVAIGARDVQTLAGLLAPDFTFAAPGVPTSGRQSFLEGVASQTATVVSIDNDQLRLVRAGDRATLCGRQRAVVVLGGKRIDDEARFCDRWERRDGRWVVVFAGPDDGRR
jgi:hypothetical protein